MIQVFYIAEKGTLRVDINGHGDLRNAEGLDVYCAAATALTNTLGVNAISAWESGFLDEEPTVYVGDEGEGRARIVVKPKPEYYGLISSIVNAITIGYQTLAVFHPEAVEYVKG